jgi:hypothetical protein
MPDSTTLIKNISNNLKKELTLNTYLGKVINLNEQIRVNKPQSIKYATTSPLFSMNPTDLSKSLSSFGVAPFVFNPTF